MKRLSIKLRVTLWFTLLMIMLVGIVLAFLLAASSNEAMAASKRQLVELVQENYDEIDCEGGRIEFDRDFQHFSDGAYLSTYDAKGNLLYGSVPAGFENTDYFQDGQLRMVRGEQGVWYLYDECHTIEGYGDIWMRAVLSGENIRSTTRSMLYFALVALPFFVVLASLSGYLLVRRAFRPVGRIAQTAQEIGESRDLSRRIALGDGKDEIYRLAGTFDTMFGRLQEAFEKERQFTSDASHELRTPISVMISQCEYALRNAATLDEARTALEEVLGQAQKMSSLISQLLMLSRADEGRQTLSLELVNLSELAELVAEQQRELACEKGILVQTQIEPGLTLWGDETMLMRLLINLTENAIKYGRYGGTVWIGLAGQGGGIVGSIRDDGIGIAQENLGKIWGRFWQADSSRSSDGAGLGLSMVEWIVKAHKGTITVQSTLGEGSTFSFFLPQQKGVVSEPDRGI